MRKVTMDEVIELLKEYKEEFGNCRVKKRYITNNGIGLGSIVYAIRHGERQYTEEEKKKLDEIGFAWKVDDCKIPVKYSFDDVLELTEAYIRDSGSKYISSLYIAPNGVPLGRILYNVKIGGRKLTPEQEKALKETGIRFRKVNRHVGRLSFDEIVKLLEEYKVEYGNMNIKVNYTTQKGIRLGAIAANIRRGIRVLTPEQKDILTNMGFNWKSTKKVISMNKVNQLIREYKSIYGDCKVPMKYVTADGIPLGMIVNSIRNGNRSISAEDIKQLNEAGFIWKTRDRRKAVSFDELLIYLKQYKKEYGDLLVPVRYITENNVNLGGLVHNIRVGSRRLTEQEKKKLDKLGFVWRVRN